MSDVAEFELIASDTRTITAHGLEAWNEEMWELLSEEQKKEVSVMRMKISAIEKVIEIKREAIADIKKIQEMLE